MISDLPAVVPTSDSPKTEQDTAIRKKPNEVRFFKQIHSEFEKVSTFFASAKKELKIRYDRVVDGKNVFINPNSETMPHRWNRVGRSAYQVHKSLLLLETFAIMNYCAFSKILKKHDKRTGYSTKVAFMTNVVNKSNFASYPDLLDMIRGCQALIEEASKRLEPDEKTKLQDEYNMLAAMLFKIKSSRDEETDDDTAADEKSCSSEGNGDKNRTRPTSVALATTINPIDMERGANKANPIPKEKPFRTISLSKMEAISHRSENLAVSESSRISPTPFEKGITSNTCVSVHHNGQKRRVSEPNIQPFKKQRYL